MLARRPGASPQPFDRRISRALPTPIISSKRAKVNTVTAPGGYNPITAPPGQAPGSGPPAPPRAAAPGPGRRARGPALRGARHSGGPGARPRPASGCWRFALPAPTRPAARRPPPPPARPGASRPPRASPPGRGTPQGLWPAPTLAEKGPASRVPLRLAAAREKTCVSSRARLAAAPSQTRGLGDRSLSGLRRLQGGPAGPEAERGQARARPESGERSGRPKPSRASRRLRGGGGRGAESAEAGEPRLSFSSGVRAAPGLAPRVWGPVFQSEPRGLQCAGTQARRGSPLPLAPAGGLTPSPASSLQPTTRSRLPLPTRAWPRGFPARTLEAWGRSLRGGEAGLGVATRRGPLRRPGLSERRPQREGLRAARAPPPLSPGRSSRELRKFKSYSNLARGTPIFSKIRRLVYLGEFTSPDPLLANSSFQELAVHASGAQPATSPRTLAQRPLSHSFPSGLEPFLWRKL